MLKSLPIVLLLMFVQSLFRIIFFLFPPKKALSILYKTSDLFYSVCFSILPESFKKELQGNLKKIYGHSSRNEVRSLLKKFCYGFFELLVLPMLKKEHFELMFEVTGIQNLKRALEHKKGVVIITPHAGNYELVPNYLSTLNYNTMKIVKTVYPEDLPAKLLNDCRRSQRVRVLNVEEENMYQQSFRILNANAIVVIQADTGALDSRHIFIKMFNRTVPAATGWKTMAERAESAVLPVFIKRGTDGKNHLRIYPYLLVNKETGDEIFQEMGNLFEEFLKENPDEWLLPLNSYEVERMVNQDQ
ncbi:MAG: lysophospholipid acyltransferase family protein [Candidatus Saganbacteria bacterium]|nr:lysophospholipid acyltransferase family protein [Candidatus Saganbacteria bacterium]